MGTRDRKDYCGIIGIRGGSVFVEFVGTPHPQEDICKGTALLCYITL